LFISFWDVSKLFYSEFKAPTAAQRGAVEPEQKCGEIISKTERSSPESVKTAKPH